MFYGITFKVMDASEGNVKTLILHGGNIALKNRLINKARKRHGQKFFSPLFFLSKRKLCC